MSIRRVEGGTGAAETGLVEFEAHYEDRGRVGVVHELSRFVREDARWVYLGGVHV